MRQFLGERHSENQNGLRRELFVQWLPANILVILSSAGGLPLDSLAEIAHKISPYASPATSAVASSVLAHTTIEERLHGVTEATHAF